MSGRGPVIALELANGRLELAPALTVDVCRTCPRRAELEITVDANSRDDTTTIGLCADCIAEALEVHAGAGILRDAGIRHDDPLELDTLGPLEPL